MFTLPFLEDLLIRFSPNSVNLLPALVRAHLAVMKMTMEIIIVVMIIMTMMMMAVITIIIMMKMMIILMLKMIRIMVMTIMIKNDRSQFKLTTCHTN